jgi:dihydroorotate dehydrogenase (fumarate)
MDHSTPDLTTHYLGLTLRSPLIVGACAPLTEKLDQIKQLEDAGASAIVMHSLFEEQLRQDELHHHHHLTHGTDSFAEALSYFPELDLFHVGAESYLEHIRQAKAQVKIPIIASLNGSTLGGWTDYAQQIEQAGADALELNLYALPTDMAQTGADVEQTYYEIIHAITRSVNLPVAVKLSPFFSNLASFAKRLSDHTGINGLVLFNRFYQPDLDIENLEVSPHILLSTAQEMRLPLRWIAILYGTMPIDFAATSGISSAEDVVKMVMVGASATMLVSVLLRHGIQHLKTIEQDLRTWLLEHEYDSIEQLQGCMSQISCPDPSAFERAQYMRSLQTYVPPMLFQQSGQPLDRAALAR